MMKTLGRETITEQPDASAERCCPPVPLDQSRVVIPATAVARFKALADATRLTILSALVASLESLCVCDLHEGIDLDQSTISHHLKVLRDAGIVTSERRGSWAYYQLHPETEAWVRTTLAALPH